MLQQSPRHGLKHMKEGDLDIRCPAQERSNILDNAMGVLGLVDGQKNSHSGLLGRAGKKTVYLLSSCESADTRGQRRACAHILLTSPRADGIRTGGLQVPHSVRHWW